MIYTVSTNRFEEENKDTGKIPINNFQITNK